MGSKPLHIRFDKIDEFIKIYNGIRYLVFASETHNEIYDRIRYLISEKGGITDSINYNIAGIKIDSYNSLSIKKTLTIILIKSVVNTTIIYL